MPLHDLARRALHELALSADPSDRTLLERLSSGSYTPSDVAAFADRIEYLFRPPTGPPRIGAKRHSVRRRPVKLCART